MARYLLDTNMLVFILGDEGFLSSETKIIVDDYLNELYTSAVNILELIQIYNIGMINQKNISHPLTGFQQLQTSYKQS